MIREINYLRKLGVLYAPLCFAYAYTMWIHHSLLKIYAISCGHFMNNNLILICSLWGAEGYNLLENVFILKNITLE